MIKKYRSVGPTILRGRIQPLGTLATAKTNDKGKTILDDHSSWVEVKQDEVLKPPAPRDAIFLGNEIGVPSVAPAPAPAPAPAELEAPIYTTFVGNEIGVPPVVPESQKAPGSLI